VKTDPGHQPWPLGLLKEKRGQDEPRPGRRRTAAEGSPLRGETGELACRGGVERNCALIRRRGKRDLGRQRMAREHKGSRGGESEHPLLSVGEEEGKKEKSGPQWIKGV